MCNYKSKSSSTSLNTDRYWLAISSFCLAQNESARFKVVLSPSTTLFLHLQGHNSTQLKAFPPFLLNRQCYKRPLSPRDNPSTSAFVPNFIYHNASNPDEEVEIKEKFFGSRRKLRIWNPGCRHLDAELLAFPAGENSRLQHRGCGMGEELGCWWSGKSNARERVSMRISISRF